MSNTKIVPHLAEPTSDITVEDQFVPIDQENSDNNCQTTQEGSHKGDNSTPLTTPQRISRASTFQSLGDSTEVILAIIKTLSDPSKRTIPSTKPSCDVKLELLSKRDAVLLASSLLFHLRSELTEEDAIEKWENEHRSMKELCEEREEVRAASEEGRMKQPEVDLRSFVLTYPSCDCLSFL